MENGRCPNMQKLNLTLIERLGQMEAEQHLMMGAILELQRRMAVTDEPIQAETAAAKSLADWSRKGLNLRHP